MKILVIGTGYIGLPIGACFAEFGNEVICMDNDKEKISQLNRGIISMYEPGLDIIVQRNFKDGNLRFSNNLKDSIKNTQIIIVAVGTPTEEKSNHANLSYIKQAIEEIASNAVNEILIIIKSTIPCGTSDILENIIKTVNPGLNFNLIFIPEFLREGKAIEDFLNPERIVIGLNSDHLRPLIENLYSPFIQKSIPILFVDRKSAELGKYVANSFLGIKVAFINEIANICEKMDADVRNVKKIIGSDSRIGDKFLDPGPGFGGACFPKDMLELITSAKEYNANLQIVEAAYKANSERPHYLIKKIKKMLGSNLSDMKLSIWGLAFKANTDDIRMSPAIEIIKLLMEEKAKIIAYDPQSIANAKKILSDIEYAENVLDSTMNADAIIIITEWEEFKNISPKELKSRMKANIIIDLRNILNSQLFIENGFQYSALGYN